MAEAKTKPGRSAIVKTGKAAVALAVPEASIPLAVAEKATEAAGRILTGDIVVTRTVRNVGTKKNPIWKETEVHYNLISVGGGLAVGAVAVLGGSIAWNGFQTIGGGLRGIKGTPLGDKISNVAAGKDKPPPPSGGSSLTCGPECIAAHVFDVWNIPACVAACIKARS